MIHLDISVKEAKLLKEMLEQYSDELGNAGCNDMYYPDDWSKTEQKVFGKRIKSVTDDDGNDHPEDTDICVLEYFQHQLDAGIEAAE